MGADNPTDDATSDFLENIADTLSDKGSDYGPAMQKGAIIKYVLAIEETVEVVELSDGRQAVVLGERPQIDTVEKSILDGMWTRFLDKVSRAFRLSFMKDADVMDESAVDAYRDMVGYAVRMAMLVLPGKGGQFSHRIDDPDPTHGDNHAGDMSMMDEVFDENREWDQ